MTAKRPVASTGAGLALALALLALAPRALAQGWAGAPAPSEALQAALTQADAGDAKALTALADGGDVNAQYYAGVLYIFGRGSIAKDAPRGCAYEQKASSARADAMHLVGMCLQTGLGGAADKTGAEAAYSRADEMGFPKSKCALGQMLMADPAQVQRGLDLCKAAGTAGDADAQSVVAGVYFSGAVVKRDPAEARKWYAMAAKQNDLDAARRLGEMYAKGDGGKKDVKKAMELWIAAEKAGDPMAPILVADQMFSQMTGGKTPGPGTYAFKNAVPVADIEVVEDWYKQASARDPRPDVKKRADYALAILAGLKTGAAQAAQAKKR